FEHITFVFASANNVKLVSASNFPLLITPAAPLPTTDTNGLLSHFCQPGPAVAHALSSSFLPNQFEATVLKCAYPQECVCTTALGVPVVPEVQGKKAISSLECVFISSLLEALSFKSSI